MADASLMFVWKAIICDGIMQRVSRFPFRHVVVARCVDYESWSSLGRAEEDGELGRFRKGWMVVWWAGGLGLKG